MRMIEERIPKKIPYTKLEGKLPTRRRRSRWVENIREGIRNERGETIEHYVGE